MLGNNTQVGCGIYKQWSVGTGKVPTVTKVTKVTKENIPLTITPPTACWYKAGRIHALMLLIPDSDLTIWM